MLKYSYAVCIYIYKIQTLSAVVCLLSLLLVHFADSFHLQKVITTFHLGQCKGNALEGITQCMSLASVHRWEILRIWEACPWKRMETRNNSPRTLMKSYFQIKILCSSAKTMYKICYVFKANTFFKISLKEIWKKKIIFSKTNNNLMKII